MNLQSTQLKKKNFHEKFYKKLIHGSWFFYLEDYESNEENKHVSELSLIFKGNWRCEFDHRDDDGLQKKQRTAQHIS